jgi:isoamylase
VRILSMYLDGYELGDRSVLIVLHGGAHAAEVTLPKPPGLRAYKRLWDSAWPRPRAPEPVNPTDGPVLMSAASMHVYRAALPG